MDLSVVCSVYNEEESLGAHYQVLRKVLEGHFKSFEIIYVDDGSVDNSVGLLQDICGKNEGVRLISFSRNFGHEAAMAAGVDHARGNAIVCMDSDLQHPPELLPELYAAYQQGFDVVNAVRLETEKQPLLRRVFTSMFYSFISKISNLHIEANASDFFLISKRVGDILRRDYREFNRFTRIIIQNIGFRNKKVYFKANERFAGESKYSFKKLFMLSVTAIISSSNLPLRLGVYVGGIFALFSLFLGFYSIIMKFYGTPYSGYTTLVVFLSFAFGILFLLLGIIGEYMGHLYMETKKRPMYIVDKHVEKDIQDRSPDTSGLKI